MTATSSSSSSDMFPWWKTPFGKLTDAYLSEVWRMRDVRLDGYPLMGTADHFLPSLSVVAAFCVCYAVLAARVGPALMSHRRPLSTRTPMLAYNAFQVVANAAMLAVGLSAWPPGGYDPLCHPVDRSDTLAASTTVFLSYCFFAMKFVDMLDTLFFVLRKNFRQVIFR